MYDFNTSAEDKLSTYEKLNPSFAVFNPIKASDPTDYTDIKPIGISSYTTPSYKVQDYASTPLENEDKITPETEVKQSPLSLKELLANASKTIASAPVQATSGNTSDFAQGIANVESGGGDYKAFNPAGGGEGAVGKYQFRWNLWKNEIKAKTGITNKEDFMNNPTAQEDFFNHYKQTTLIPQMKEIKKEYPNPGLDDQQIMSLLHFRGIGSRSKNTGLRGLLANGGLDKKQETFNLSPLEYLKQTKVK